jgi:hypothetical protein
MTSNISAFRALSAEEQAWEIDHETGYGDNAPSAAWLAEVLPLAAPEALALCSRKSPHPLHVAASRGHGLILRTLLPFFPDDVNGVNIAQQTPLHVAASRGYADCAQAMLDAGADLDLLERQGRTPLMLAALSCDEKTVRVLLPRSNLFVENVDGAGQRADALDLAVISGGTAAAAAIGEVARSAFLSADEALASLAAASALRAFRDAMSIKRFEMADALADMVPAAVLRTKTRSCIDQMPAAKALLERDQLLRETLRAVARTEKKSKKASTRLPVGSIDPALDSGGDPSRSSNLGAEPAAPCAKPKAGRARRV